MDNLNFASNAKVTLEGESASLIELVAKLLTFGKSKGLILLLL